MSSIFDTDTSGAAQAWVFLRKLGYSEAGAAGIIGNMQAESGCIACNLEVGMRSKKNLNMTSELYAAFTDKNNVWYEAVSGKGGYTYSLETESYSIYRDSLVNYVGWGMCQWTFLTRKDALLKLKLDKGYSSIASVDLQFDFLLQEVSGYGSLELFKKVQDVDEATVTFYSTFEMPGAPFDEAHRASTRLKEAHSAYNKYHGLPIPGVETEEKSILGNGSYRTKVISVMQSWLGKNELDGSHHAIIDVYNTIPNVPQMSYTADWCAACTSAAFLKAGLANIFPCGCFCPDIVEAATLRGIFIENDAYVPTSGDVIVYDYAYFLSGHKLGVGVGDNRGTPRHVGIVEYVENGRIHTLEGNVKKVEGDENRWVLRKDHAINSPDIRGFIIPKYPTGTTSLDSIYYPQLSSTYYDYVELTLLYEETTKTFTPLALHNQTILAEQNANNNYKKTNGLDLLSSASLVECPFIIAKIGDITFGSYTKEGSALNATAAKTVTYPNYMNSILIVKTNGTLNLYTLSMIYQITLGDDPNLLDKIFSSVGIGGSIFLTYGDWEAPSFIFKEEEAMIEKVASNIDFASQKITYTITCISKAFLAAAAKHDFNFTSYKVSDLIKNKLLTNSNYGLSQLFPGMTAKNINNNGWIASDDIVVNLEAQSLMDSLTYLNYVVGCMTAASATTDNTIKDSTYHLVIMDDVNNEYGGSYFKIVKIGTSTKTLVQADMYSVDIGFPTSTLVTEFNIVLDDSWSILYNYANSFSAELYKYTINNKGELLATKKSATAATTKESEKTWWTAVTTHPIKATLTIKGLLRPAILMTYVRINAYFYGEKHISSGIYVITKQEDKIDASGYRTTLSLTRVAGDDDGDTAVAITPTTQKAVTLTTKKRTAVAASDNIVWANSTAYNLDEWNNIYTDADGNKYYTPDPDANPGGTVGNQILKVESENTTLTTNTESKTELTDTKKSYLEMYQKRLQEAQAKIDAERAARVINNKSGGIWG